MESTIEGSTSDSRPDFVIWEPSLQATFGQPIPVEVVRIRSGFNAARRRLRLMLAATGATSLLAVDVGNLDTRLEWRVADGPRRHFVLVVPLRGLEQSLRTHPIGEALPQLRRQAVQRAELTK
jgi:hypothetical protein